MDNKWVNFSLKGKLESYCNGFGSPTPINIEKFLSGKTTFRNEASCFYLYLNGIAFDILLSTDMFEDFIKVGEIHGKFYNVENVDEDKFDVGEVFDEIDQYTFDVYDLTKKLEGDDAAICSDNIYSIDSLYIEPEFRNQGIGSCAVMLLSDALKTQFNRKVGYIVSQSTPIYKVGTDATIKEEEYPLLEKRLDKFWSNMGFKKKGSYVVFNNDLIMQDIFVKNKSK